MLLKVDAAVTVPVNVMPLIDDTDFKTIETDVNYNATGLELIWNFVTSAGAQSHTAVTPTDTGGNYDWTEIGHGMFSIEIPASGGASINNDTEGYGWFTGVATGVLPWRGPIITFAPAHVVDGLVTGSDKLQVDVTEANGGSLATNTATVKLKHLDVTNDSGPGVIFKSTGGGAGGHGLLCESAASSADNAGLAAIGINNGIKATCNSSGPGIAAVGAGGGADIDADITGNLTGDITGTITGDLTGDVTGKVLGGGSGTITAVGAWAAGAAGAAVALEGADSDTLETLSDELDAISLLIGTPVVSVSTDIAGLDTKIGSPVVSLTTDIGAISTLIGTPADTDVSTDIANIATTIGTPADTDIATDISNVSTLIGTPAVDIATDISAISTLIGTPADTDVSTDIANVAAVTTKLDSTLELDGVGPAYQFTAAAMDQVTASVDVADFFDTDSGETAASAVAGSVVYEIVNNGSADWTAAEKEQIRHKLDIDGTQTAPSVEGSTVKLADTTDTDKISTLSYRLSYSKLLNVHTVRTGEFTASWDGDDFTGDFQIKVWFAQLNSDGSDILVEGEGDYGTLIGTLAPGSYPGQPTWTENGSFPGGDGLTDGILYVEGLSTGSLSEGWLTLSLSSDSQFGPWEMRFKYSGYTDGDTNFLVGVNGEQYHRQSVQLVAALASTKPILSVQSMAYQNVATITRNVDNTLDETTHADGSVSKINYTAGYATSVTEA